MLEILNYLRARYLSEKAQGMAEYALVLAAIVVLVAAVMGTDNGLKDAVNNAFTKVSNQINKNS